MQTGIGGTNEHMYVCMYKLELKLNYQSAISVFFITVHSAVTFAHSNRSISVASHNCTCPYKLSVCLTMTDTTPSQNTALSS